MPDFFALYNCKYKNCSKNVQDIHKTMNRWLITRLLPMCEQIEVTTYLYWRCDASLDLASSGFVTDSIFI
jgi:hypothetical protein